jgi:putative solute:sodium symporter small subunit
MADPTSPSDATAPAAAVRLAAARHWRRMVWLTLSLLLVWAGLGLGCGVWFAAELAPYRLGGFPLGFWFAQQGSILGFVLLVLIYATGMAVIDRAHRRELQRAIAAESRR